MTAFKPGERIAVPALPVLKIESGVAVLKKMRPLAQGGCGARHQVRVEAPFFIRGGFRVERVVKYKVPGWAFEVVFRTPYGSFVRERLPQRDIYVDEAPDPRQLAEKLAKEMYGDKVAEIVNIEVKEGPKPVAVYVRKFRHGTTVEIPENDYFKHVHGPYYFVYEFVSSDEAKLVDDDSRVDYVLYLFDHSVESRVGCASIKVLSNNGVVWQQSRNTCCATASFAVAALVARYGSRVVIARNNPPYRGCCETWTVEEWESALPPRRLSSYEATEPVVSNMSPEEVA